jgi:hypothetical protein
MKCLLLGVSLLIGSAGFSHAAVLKALAIAGASASVSEIDEDGVWSGISDGGFDESFSYNSSVAVNRGVGFAAGTASASAEASARVWFGGFSLNTRSAASAECLTPGCTAMSGGFAGSNASIDDELDLYGRTGLGYLRVATTTIKDSSDGSVFLWFQIGGVDALSLAPNSFVDIPFVWGVPMAVQAIGSITASVANSGSSYATGGVTIDSIEVLDQNKNPVADFGWRADSNGAYAFVNGTEIPEPGTLLAGFGVIGLIAWRRLHRSR